MFCGGCGVESKDNHKYCSGCGTPLAGTTAADHILLEELSGRVARLEARVPRTMILSKRFWARSFGIMGHTIAGNLLFVIPILLLLVIATLAIPALLRSRQGANEAAAVSHLRAITTAEREHFLSTGKYGTLEELVDSRSLDESFLQTKAGYQFVIEAESDNYTAVATPATTNTGRYLYYITPEGVVRYSHEKNGAPPGKAGQPVR